MILRKIAHYSLYLILIGSGVCFYLVQTNPDARYFVQSLLGLAPCQKPITYSIGILDSDFGLSKENLLKAITAAKSVWEEPIGKKLFSFADDGKLTINLIYDYRQTATDKLKSLSPQIDASKNAYESLKAQYDSLKSTYASRRQKLDAMISQFDVKKQNYDTQVEYWNNRGGAPKNEYQTLSVEQQELRIMVGEINQKQSELNSLVAQINSLVDPLNQAARQINAGVSTYNKIGASTGREFNEGLYVSDVSGKHIDIYQYNDQNQLIRVLAHELGHALGLEHVQDPKAIMYEFNQAENLSPTRTDLAMLKTICRIE